MGFSKKKIILISAVILAGLFIYNWRDVYQWGYKSLGYLEYDVPLIEIQTDLNYLDSLSDDRNKAIEDGWITLGKKDLVPTQITTIDGTVDAKYRLKGDYLDHLLSEKWSYRVQTNDSIRGLQKFSLHHPIRRNNISEIFWQYACHREGIISLDYDIVQLNINDVSFGLYAIEEHFGRNFCSRRGLDGFVIRFEDKEYWKGKVSNSLNSEKLTIENAKIDSYNTPDIKKDTALWKQHEHLMGQLQNWVDGSLFTSQIFDINKLAKYLALADLCSGQHALLWFNMRLYYNPKTKLLEPIAFDGDLYSTIKSPAIVDAEKQSDCQKFHCRLFRDSSFVLAYKKELENLSAGTYYQKLVEDFNSTAKKYQNILNWEFPRYEFNNDFVKTNAITIQRYLKNNPQ